MTKQKKTFGTKTFEQKDKSNFQVFNQVKNAERTHGNTYCKYNLQGIECVLLSNLTRLL